MDDSTARVTGQVVQVARSNTRSAPDKRMVIRELDGEIQTDV